jgi:hypothetical protein
MKQCNDVQSLDNVWFGKERSLLQTHELGQNFFVECSLHSFIYRGIIPRLPCLLGSELPLKSKTQLQEATQCVPSYKDPL